mmetsp:Transcript_37172/g.35829  ORF Transcript_37172/g.35829 Transcript_37172/m.35829 type:complete len:176 (+) Transcript_37172:24-551(+)
MSNDVVHLFLNEVGDEAYIVDLGNPITANGLSALIEDISSIKHIYIFITHYHIDHCQSLAGFVKNTDILMTMIVPRDMAIPFSGWYLENYPHVFNKIENGQLEIKMIADEWMQFQGYEIKALLTYKFEDNTLMHSTVNSVPVWRDTYGNHKIFSGDFVYSTEYMKQSLEYKLSAV